MTVVVVFADAAPAVAMSAAVASARYVFIVVPSKVVQPCAAVIIA
jgi:hypothetical protein